jgi:hypothetical protein
MVVGRPQQSPSLFHNSQGVPSAAMKMLGSMAPPSAMGHTKADDESSTNGPAGLVLVALEIHIALDGPLAVWMQPADAGSAKHTKGTVAGVE